MVAISFVIKRNQEVQKYDSQKIINYISKVSLDLNDINPQKILKMSENQFYNKIPTSQILAILINICSNQISEVSPDYQFVTSRLMVNAMRREVWNSFYPIDSLYARVQSRINNNIYDPIILDLYTKDEFATIESFIDYDRDYIITYSGIRQFYDKYLMKNRITNDLQELPQEANILICMYMFMNEQDKELRIHYIKTMYNHLSNLIISLPTPIYAGVRGTIKSFSSCCVIDCGDTTDSILSTNYVIGKVITKRFGIGINVNKIRGVGASVANNQVIHTGVVPFLKMFEASTKGFVQNGIRGGQSTLSFPFWNWEVLTIIELKNNKGVVENRVRGMDYSIGINRLFLQRVKDNECITLFSAEDIPLLSNDYTHSYEQFKNIYESYENDPKIIRKQKIKALDLMKKIAKERFETGRIYVYFMDNMNYYSVFKESIFSSNLCQEICLPTSPVDITTNSGLISVCILSCINVGRIESWEQLEEICEIIVRFLNEMIDYQEYVFPQIRRSAVDYRPLGIGISDLFHLLAKKKLKYNFIECRNFVHELSERFQYYLLKSSCKLAKEKGPCKEFSKSKYSDLILPIDNYKSTVDSFISKVEYVCDWEQLRQNIKQYGLRNTCLSAIPPTASSCSISNSTPGIDPPRSIITNKLSKHGTFKQIIPDIKKYEQYYTFQKDVNNSDYFKLIGVIQKFIDQGISTNSFYMNSDDVSIGDVVNEIFMAYNCGLKTLYYLNSNKGVDEDIHRAMSCDGISSTKQVKLIKCCGNGCGNCIYTDSGNDGGNEDKNENDELQYEQHGVCDGGACSI